MGPLDLVRHPLIFTGITIPEFVRWYVFDQPSKILKSYFAYLRAFVEVFSFTFLAKTLFAPWRQIQDDVERPGFNLEKFLQSLTLNAVSRVIGFLFRITTLAIGLTAVALLTVCFAAYYMAWLLFPVLFWVAISYFISGVF